MTAHNINDAKASGKGIVRCLIFANSPNLIGTIFRVVKSISFKSHTIQTLLTR